MKNPAAGNPPSELVITGATIITGDDEQRVLKDASILVRGNRIVEITTRPLDPMDIAEARHIDARGMVATPGFVNVHTHAILTMVRGVAEDMGFAPAYTPGVPHGHEVTEEEAVALAELGALEALLFGSTLINDTYVHQNLTLPAMAATGIRAFGCGRIHDVDFSRVHLGEWEHHTSIGRRTLDEAVELHAAFDGEADGRIGVQLSPHAPDTCSTDLLAEIERASAELGCRVNTHLSQSKVEVDRIRNRDGCSPPELLEELGLLNDRLIAAHCIHVSDSDSDIGRIGGAGVNVAHIAKGNQTHGHTAPTLALRQAGANITLATDNMHADMVEVMRWALATGRIRKGAVDADWQPTTVFGMATRQGARAMGLEDEIGSLEVGKKADIVLFDFRRPHLTPLLDPLGNLVHTAQGRDVHTVIVDGQVVVESGRALLVDQEAIMRRAQAAAEALWRRAKAN